MSYGKFQYQKSVKQRHQKVKQKKTEIKGIRLSLRIGQHDLAIKAKQTEKFLNQGNKVKIEIFLRGREKAHLDLAKEKLNDFIQLIPLAVKIEQEIKKQPRGLNMVISKDEKQIKD